MQWNRRKFISAAGATALAATALPKIVSAQIDLGGRTLHSLSDGNLTLPTGLIFDPVPEAEKRPFLASHAITDSLTPPCNVTLLRDGARNVLFDLGAGQEFQATAGFLMEALDTVGLTPDDITDVVFTHAHPDHLWGLLDDFDDLAFPNAAYMIGQSEWDYWTAPDTVDTIGEARIPFAVGAARRLDRIADQIRLVRDGEEILPGIAARATFGHTPGHLAFEIGAGSDSVMVLGDCIANEHAAFERPDWPSGSDQDIDTGVATRVALLDQLAGSQMQVVGYHLPGNGIGRVERHAGAYRFIPDA